MVKSILLICLLGLCRGIVHAQDMLEIQGTSPSLYISHTVKKGENFYSLGRAYGISPKEIAAANKISMDQGLQLGHTLHIPLTTANFFQQADATGTPVYHKVTEKETLYRVSVNFNKVPLDNIRRWNNFSGDGLKKDSYLVIGFLKNVGDGNGSVRPTETVKEVVKEKTAAPPEETPAPVATTPVDESTKKDPVAAVTTGPAPATSNNDFEQLYEQQTSGKNIVTEKGPGSWFKSNAVGKYYALHNKVPRGTIIKVTNPLNGKSIYAKVLDVIPQMKSNAGLIVKLSDGAMMALSNTEARFYCELSYEN